MSKTTMPANDPTIKVSKNLIMVVIVLLALFLTIGFILLRIRDVEDAKTGLLSHLSEQYYPETFTISDRVDCLKNNYDDASYCWSVTSNDTNVQFTATATYSNYILSYNYYYYHDDYEKQLINYVISQFESDYIGAYADKSQNYYVYLTKKSTGENLSLYEYSSATLAGELARFCTLAAKTHSHSTRRFAVYFQFSDYSSLSCNYSSSSARYLETELDRLQSRQY